MFENDDLNNKDDFEEEYNKNEGENYVLRGQQEKIKKNLKNFDKIKKNLKKYEGKEISYNKLHNSSSEEDNEIDTNEKKEESNYEEENELSSNKEENNSKEE